MSTPSCEPGVSSAQRRCITPKHCRAARLGCHCVGLLRQRNAFKEARPLAGAVQGTRRDVIFVVHAFAWHPTADGQLALIELRVATGYTGSIVWDALQEVCMRWV